MSDTLSKERVELELRGESLAQARELNLDNTQCSGGTVEGVFDECVNLESLSLIGIGLNSLRGFPHLPSLAVLDLAENRLSGGLEKLATQCPSLVHLNLANNKLPSVDQLAPLKTLDTLRAIVLDSNPLANASNYRKAVFEALPQLNYVDDEDRDGNAAPSDEEGDDDEEEEDDEGDDDEEDDGGEDEDEDDDEDDDDDEPGLAYLSRNNLEDEDEEEDETFVAGEEEEDEDEDEEDEDEDEDDDEQGGPSTKRQRTG